MLTRPEVVRYYRHSVIEVLAGEYAPYLGLPAGAGFPFLVAVMDRLEDLEDLSDLVAVRRIFDQELASFRTSP